MRAPVLINHKTWPSTYSLRFHIAAVVILAALVLIFGARLIVSWRYLRNEPKAFESERSQLEVTRSLLITQKALDQSLAKSTTEADDFYNTRLPFALSQVLTDIGEIVKRTGVGYTRGQFVYSPYLAGPYALTRIGADATFSGSYPAVMDTINRIERDRLFFIVSHVALDGQQSGQVTLRIQLETYLRPPVTTEASPLSPSNTGR